MDQSQLEAELKAMKETVSLLRAQLAEMTEVAQTQRKAPFVETAEEGLDALRKEFEGLGEAGQRFLGEAKAKAESNPLMTLAIAFGIGFVIGKLFEKD